MHQTNRNIIVVAFTSLLNLSATGCAGPAGVTTGDSPSTHAPHAKNVVLFIGDGMGVSTVTATRIFDGQARGLQGEEHVLAFEEFPNVALVKTYNSNQQVPDSAGTTTAMMSGRKTKAGVINVGAGVSRRDCAAALTAIERPGRSRLHGPAAAGRGRRAAPRG